MPIIENIEPIKIKVLSKAKSPNSLCVNLTPIKIVAVIEKRTIRKADIATWIKWRIILLGTSLYRN